MDGRMLIFYIYVGVGYLVTLVCLGLALWAFADCARRNAAGFEANFKRTKGFWLGLTGGGSAFALLALLLGPSSGLFGLGIINIVAVTAAGVYLADVRPAIASR